MTVQFTEKADAEFIDALAAICDMWGATYCNRDTRTLVVHPKNLEAERVLKAQLAQMVTDNAPLNWDDTAT